MRLRLSEGSALTQSYAVREFGREILVLASEPIDSGKLDQIIRKATEKGD